VEDAQVFHLNRKASRSVLESAFIMMHEPMKTMKELPKNVG
jgi:hypothetical protein